MKTNSTIGFIGTGVMGKSMAKHFIQQGFNLIIHNRTKEKAIELQNLGAKWASSIRDVSEQADVIITMVGYPKDVEEIYFAEHGILRHAKPNTIAIDMTTSNPALARKIYQKAIEKEIHILDAPVSGGDVGARDGTLTIMVGGSEAIFQSVKPLLEIIGKNIVYQGSIGAGQHTKMCNQIAIASTMIGMCESLSYAKCVGLNLNNVLKSIGYGAAGSWSLSNLAPRIIAGNYEPGFYVKHFVKDIAIALEVSDKYKLNLPGLTLAKNLYDELSRLGYDDLGTQALFKIYNLD